MGLYKDLPVYRDCYELLIKVYNMTNKFSREHKFSLGQDMKRDALTMFRSLYRANRSTDKAKELEIFLDDFELLKMEIRLCTDLRLLPLSKLAEISLLIDSISRQITAWRKKSQVKTLHAGTV